jgi:hypothetical protein
MPEAPPIPEMPPVPAIPPVPPAAPVPPVDSEFVPAQPPITTTVASATANLMRLSIMRCPSLTVVEDAVREKYH